MPTVRFSVDQQRIVHETIGEETIAIDLEAGTYHSLTGAGPAIWALLAGGWSLEEAAGELAARHPETGAAAIRDAVRSFAAQLGETGLLDPDPARAERAPAPPAAAGAWSAPALASYTDMQYLLLLDPVHDAAPAGWPAARAPVEEPA